eukprot:m.45744 g.45744  ORF g.45744 m.45744 type:complete len:984 (-) comp11041_c0_seq1:17-2968(-)
MAVPSHETALRLAGAVGRGQLTGAELEKQSREFSARAASLLNKESRSFLNALVLDYQESGVIDELLLGLSRVLNKQKKLDLLPHIRSFVPNEHLPAYDDECGVWMATNTPRLVSAPPFQGPPRPSLTLELKQKKGCGFGFTVAAVEQGLCVASVTALSDAERAGLRPNDLILAINSKRVWLRSVAEISKASADLLKAKTVRLLIRPAAALSSALPLAAPAPASKATTTTTSAKPAKQMPSCDQEVQVARQPLGVISTNSTNIAAGGKVAPMAAVLAKKSTANKVAATTSQQELKRVTMQVTAGAMGLSISGGCDQGRPVTVRGVEAGSVAAMAGLVAGDELVEVNGISLSGLDHVRVVQIMHSSSLLVLTVLSKVPTIPSSSSTTTRLSQQSSANTAAAAAAIGAARSRHPERRVLSPRRAGAAASQGAAVLAWGPPSPRAAYDEWMRSPKRTRDGEAHRLATHGRAGSGGSGGSNGGEYVEIEELNDDRHSDTWEDRAEMGTARSLAAHPLRALMLGDDAVPSITLTSAPRTHNHDPDPASSDTDAHAFFKLPSEISPKRTRLAPVPAPRRPHTTSTTLGLRATRPAAHTLARSLLSLPNRPSTVPSRPAPPAPAPRPLSGPPPSLMFTPTLVAASSSSAPASLTAGTGECNGNAVSPTEAMLRKEEHGEESLVTAVAGLRLGTLNAYSDRHPIQYPHVNHETRRQVSFIPDLVHVAAAAAQPAPPPACRTANQHSNKANIAEPSRGSVPPPAPPLPPNAIYAVVNKHKSSAPSTQPKQATTTTATATSNTTRADFSTPTPTTRPVPRPRPAATFTSPALVPPPPAGPVRTLPRDESESTTEATSAPPPPPPLPPAGFRIVHPPPAALTTPAPTISSRVPPQVTSSNHAAVLGDIRSFRRDRLRNTPPNAAKGDAGDGARASAGASSHAHGQTSTAAQARIAGNRLELGSAITAALKQRFRQVRTADEEDDSQERAWRIESP